MKRACVLLADGFEEVEAITPIDYLRRAGVEVVTAGMTGLEVTGGHDVDVRTDTSLAEVAGETFDAVVVPGGGGGTANLATSALVRDFIRRHFAAGKIVAAICAAPAVVLHESCGILAGKRFTGYPGTEAKVTAASGAAGAVFVADRVVVDGNLITSRAAGTAGDFAYVLVTALVGEEAADTLAEKVLLG